MPTNRKRIGYLPREAVHLSINEIAKNENLSQSKVVGILVEEALQRRGKKIFESTEDKANSYQRELIDKPKKSKDFFYDEMNELVSDSGIIYNKKRESPNLQSYESNEEQLKSLYKEFIAFRNFINKYNN